MNHSMLFCLILIFQACTVSPANKPINSQNNSLISPYRGSNDVSDDLFKQEERPDLEDTSIDYYNLRSSRGLIRTNLVKTNNARALRFYNDDKSVWYEFPFNIDGDKILKSKNENFRPFRYDSVENNVVLNLIGEREEYYEVVVNDETGDTKFIKKGDPVVRRTTWEEYITDCFAVEFDPKTNPLYREPMGGLMSNVIKKNLSFHPEKISGEWLKVRWYEANDDKKLAMVGWIRWKVKDRIVINLFETA